MKSAKLKAAGIVAGVAALAFVTTPADAVDGADPSGVDFDPACVVGHPLAPVGEPDNVPSPGTNANCLVGTYDGSTETTDFTNVNLSSVGGQMVATFKVSGPIPAAGSTTPPALGAADLPNSTFVGFGYKAMFQNPQLQNNTPYLSTTRLTNTPIYGLNEHWGDGFHFFVGFDAVWDGARWIHIAYVGTYDPSPTGGFFLDELGVSSSPGVWNDDDPTCFARVAGDWDVILGAGTVTVKVKGIVKSGWFLSVTGCIESWYAEPGNSIINIKGLSTADAVVTMPITVPVSLVPAFSDVTSIGGFTSFSDTTGGHSWNTGLGAILASVGGDVATTPCKNEGQLGIRPCMSYTPGLARLPAATELLEVDQEQELTRVLGSVPDTLGRGPRCWNYTLGGVMPSNALWVPDQPCHIDDDNVPGPSGNVDPGVGRGTFFAEWWDTPFGFTF